MPSQTTASPHFVIFVCCPSELHLQQVASTTRRLYRSATQESLSLRCSKFFVAHLYLNRDGVLTLPISRSTSPRVAFSMALEGGIGQFQMPLEQWFYELPLGTRVWTTGAILTSVLVQCNVVTPFQLFYSLRAVFVKNQVSRILRLPLRTGRWL